MPPEITSREPVTAATAATRLRRRPGTIRSWATRYHARKLGTHVVDGARRTVYDWIDLATIARLIRCGHDVPPTPEERDLLTL